MNERSFFILFLSIFLIFLIVSWKTLINEMVSIRKLERC